MKSTNYTFDGNGAHIWSPNTCDFCKIFYVSGIFTDGKIRQFHSRRKSAESNKCRYLQLEGRVVGERQLSGQDFNNFWREKRFRAAVRRPIGNLMRGSEHIIENRDI